MRRTRKQNLAAHMTSERPDRQWTIDSLSDFLQADEAILWHRRGEFVEYRHAGMSPERAMGLAVNIGDSLARVVATGEALELTPEPYAAESFSRGEIEQLMFSVGSRDERLFQKLRDMRARLA